MADLLERAALAAQAPDWRSWDGFVLAVEDGDTAHLGMHLRRSRGKSRPLGFHVYVENNFENVHESLRFYGINAAEHATPAGDAATAWLSTVLTPGLQVKVETIPVLKVIEHLPDDETEKYGRFLAQVVLVDGTVVNDLAVSTGHASYWDGHGPRPVPGGMRMPTSKRIRR